MELEGKLRLQGGVQYLGKVSTLTVVLNDGYELLFTSTVPGFNGTSNWYKWRELVEPVTKRNFRISQLRSSVTLLTPGSDTEGEPYYTAGVEGSNLESLIKSALDKIAHHCSLRLVPLPVVLNRNIES
ncbi:unannotated protein [freshwater metagenome]|uniref:Unannotated protein n=1 Tax=freshwater metagenome TaxID=449393 RepID=A0A6J6N0J5_9ZZZZ